MTQPTEPIEFAGAADDIVSRFAGNNDLNAAALAALSTICPTSTDAQSTAEHGRDWWPLAMHWALQGKTPRRAGAVCTPTNSTQVAAIVAVCNAHDLPLTVAGGRSGVCGSSVPLYGGVVLDVTAMQGIVSVDTVSGIVEVLPGTFGPDFENELQSKYQLTVGHFPQSFDISTVGGWVACRGAGQYSTRYGKIEDMVVGLEIVLANGDIVRTGGAPAAAIGPDLTSLFVGSEGTLGVITKVWLRAHPVAQFQARAAYVFPSFADGMHACRDSVRNGATPAVLRLYDEIESKRSHGLDGTQCTLLVLDEGDERLVKATLDIVRECAISNRGRVGDVELVEKWLHHRNDTSGLQALTRKGYIVDTMEVSAPWSKLESIFNDVRTAFMSAVGARSASCHLSHSYLDGACLYFTFAGDKTDAVEDNYIAMWNAGQRAAIACGASVSHHHGIGINRARFMQESLGNAMQLLQGLKNTLDPKDLLNPGKIGLTSLRNNGRQVWP
ncbi:MAG: FAD-binding oxidoreductase [Ilumatobacteraceae bacterium]